MNLERLYKILGETTVQLRKGAEVEIERVGHMEAMHVYDMPHESETLPEVIKVDCILLTVGVYPERAKAHRAELITILNDYSEPERLAGGPSYIEVGAAIGDQGAAFQLFALGEILKLWTVITPKLFHFDDVTAKTMASQGFVMISGYKRGE